MNKKNIHLKLPYIFFSLILSLVFNVTPAQKIEIKANHIMNAMEKIHVSPIGVNNNLSNRIFEIFITSLDPNGLYFLNTDIEYFHNFKDSLDEQIQSKNISFYKSVSDTLFNRQHQVLEIMQQIFNEQQEFLKLDSLYINTLENIQYSDNLVDLKKKWTKHFKLDLLSYYYETEPDFTKQSSEKHIENLRNNAALVKTEWLCEHNYWIDTSYYYEYTADQYLNAITHSYDPHSTYFNETDKNNFQDLLSSELLSFGISFIKENKVFKISSLSPGNEAWKSGILNVHDQIISIRLEDSSYINFTCMDVSELNSVLDNDKINQITITIKKKSGEVISADISKSKIINKDNIISSFVLSGKTKVGYISLPSFYQNVEGFERAGCGNDVAKEILKLKKDSIKGLILDLRFNGGGSLYEAIDLAGIFIDVGILSLIQDQKGKPYVMKDFNRGRAYRDPVIIMINGASASASEVLAGSLQSYNRALIVGQNSFGKSTGQIILPIDTNKWNSNFYDNFFTSSDFIKVTTSKLYNINQSSHQLSGIKPDVEIPSIWDNYIPSERDEKFAIANDSTTKKVYYKPYPNININELVSNTSKRHATDSTYKQIIYLNDSIKASLNNTKVIPLDIKGFYEYLNKNKAAVSNIKEKIKVVTPVFTISSPSYYNEIAQMDELFTLRNKKIKQRHTQDFELNEAYKIMLDYINKK